MSGKWASSRRRQQLPRDWPAIRTQVLSRDAHRCVICAAPANQVDHIGNPADHTPSNLRSLCEPCHKQHTQQQAQQAQQQRRARGRLPAEQHPGAL